nr:hypothetical protein Itr_chr08CG14940 [Ipomoea trifida]
MENVEEKGALIAVVHAGNREGKESTAARHAKASFLHEPASKVRRGRRRGFIAKNYGNTGVELVQTAEVEASLIEHEQLYGERWHNEKAVVVALFFFFTPSSRYVTFSTSISLTVFFSFLLHNHSAVVGSSSAVNNRNRHCHSILLAAQIAASRSRQGCGHPQAALRLDKKSLHVQILMDDRKQSVSGIKQKQKLVRRGKPESAHNFPLYLLLVVKSLANSKQMMNGMQAVLDKVLQGMTALQNDQRTILDV